MEPFSWTEYEKQHPHKARLRRAWWWTSDAMITLICVLIGILLFVVGSMIVSGIWPVDPGDLY